MVAKEFEVGDLVWAKMKGFPSWPGKIIEPPADVKLPKQKKPQHYVYFFGSDNHAWILEENIVPHDDSMIQSASKIKFAAYQSAIEAIIDQKNSVKKEKIVMDKIDQNESSVKNKEVVMDKVLKENEQDANKELPQNNLIKTTFKRNKTPNSVKSVSKKSEKKKYKYTSVKKVDVPVQRKILKKRPLYFIDSDTNGADSLASYPKSQRMENDYADLLASVSPNTGYSHFATILPSYDSSYHQSCPGILSRPEYIERPPTPDLDLSDVSEALKGREIVACSKKIGFLGLGIMGQGIVKNLLNSGHNVTVWNRTPGKTDIFLKAGASKALTPADVVAACDITFCCVSDRDAVKCLVFGNCGVLKGLESCPGSNKGYVEMTSIDPELSREVNVGITSKGGRYLEAPVAGSKKYAMEGTLFILVAGDRTLYEECETCFRAIGNNAFYLSSEVGTGAKMNLIHSMLNGTLKAAMAEAMSFVERCKLSQDDFLKSFESGPLNCPAMLDVGHAIFQHNYVTNTPLKHVQKDLNLCLKLRALTDQPLPVAAAANEVYKHAKQLRYADHDVSAVYEGARC